MIVFDASTLVSAAHKPDSVPEQALLRAEDVDVFALSRAVESEITEVLGRPKFAHAITLAARDHFFRVLRDSAVWFEPAVRVTDCRDAKDNKYLELALAAGAETIVSSDLDLPVVDPWRGARILRPAAYLAATEPIPVGPTAANGLRSSATAEEPGLRPYPRPKCAIRFTPSARATPSSVVKRGSPFSLNAL
jgi:putative PIN family toxin of toxin-antitoxin system